MNIKTANTVNPKISSALSEIEKQIGDTKPNLIIFFASTSYEPEKLALSINSSFPDTIIVGCSSAGEISSRGFQQKGIVAAAFADQNIAAAVELLAPLDKFRTLEAKTAIDNCCQKLGITADSLNQNRHFGMLLIDGLSAMEENVISALSMSAPSLKITGGSAADHNYNKTYVFHNGKHYSNAAIFLLFQTQKQFEIISRHHFIPTETECVVTKADHAKRMILEINGKPAAAEYARLIDFKSSKFTDKVVSQNPFGFEIDNQFYIRSVLAVSKNIIKLASAINEGTVLRLMKPGNMIEDTNNMLQELKKRMNSKISLLLLFNCLARYVEARNRGIIKELEKSFKNIPLLGFNTFGEQFQSLHINHSITGVALGE